jgi:hypothetical protein
MRRVQETLPRELRDMIYMELFDLEKPRMMHIDSILRRMWTEKYYRYGAPSREPWFLARVDPYTRRDMYELLYERYYPTLDTDEDLCALYKLANTDELGCGLVPMHFVKNIKIRLGRSMCSLRDPALGKTTFIPYHQSWKCCFGALLAVRNKEYFQMRLEIVEDYVSINYNLAHLLDVFKPIFTRLVAAGSTIQIVYPPPVRWRREELPEIDLTEYYTTQKEAWAESFRSRIAQWNEAGNRLADNMHTWHKLVVYSDEDEEYRWGEYLKRMKCMEMGIEEQRKEKEKKEEEAARQSLMMREEFMPIRVVGKNGRRRHKH